MKNILLRDAFPDFDQELRNALYAAGELHLYKKDEIIHRHNHQLDSTALIMSGCVKMYRENEQLNGLEFLIAFLGKGKCYGGSLSEESPEDVRKSLLTFKAIEPTHILTIPFPIKDQLTKQFDQWYKYILQTNVQFFGVYVTLIDNIVFNTLEKRVDFYLFQLMEACNTTMLKVTHQEIADSLNASRESVSRILKKKEASHQVRLGHTTIEILEFLL